MAEFCLDCWNRINGTNDPPDQYVISKDLELCEGCGMWKHVIITERDVYRPCFVRFPAFPSKWFTHFKALFKNNLRRGPGKGPGR